MSADQGPIIICEPRQDCADPHIYRWHCMRGFDGAPDDVCPLTVCERRGANRPMTTTSKETNHGQVT